MAAIWSSEFAWVLCRTGLRFGDRPTAGLRAVLADSPGSETPGRSPSTPLPPKYDTAPSPHTERHRRLALLLPWSLGEQVRDKTGFCARDAPHGRVAVGQVDQAADTAGDGVLGKRRISQLP